MQNHFNLDSSNCSLITLPIGTKIVQTPLKVCFHSIYRIYGIKTSCLLTPLPLANCPNFLLKVFFNPSLNKLIKVCGNGIIQNAENSNAVVALAQLRLRICLQCCKDSVPGCFHQLSALQTKWETFYKGSFVIGRL